jgi:enoyl-CoA hydratase/carnithine racemase
MQDELLVEKKNWVCTLTLNRPERNNGLTIGLMKRLTEEMNAINNDPDTRVVILRGGGDKAFSIGLDLAGEMEKGKAAEDLPSNIDVLTPIITNMMNSVADCRCPVIAMIYGDALAGACDLAVCCDIRVAADTSNFSMHAVKVGATYLFEGIQRFINLVGVGYTKEIFLTASRFSAKRALEMGMVNYVVPAEELLPTTEALAKNIAELAPLALSGTKEIISKLLRYQQTLEEKQKAELNAIADIAKHSEDIREAAKAMSEGRKPNYKRR